ncbi:MAG: nucleotidyltransferase family protein [Limisphaerales bacterium]
MKAMVLCAGYGTRLHTLTQEIPKPMLLLEGRPMLEYILTNLKQNGFNEITINLHFKPEMIKSYFGNGSQWNLTLTYSYEPRLLGTAGAIKNIEIFFRNEREFLIHYGDVITDQNFELMRRFHGERQAIATALVHQSAKSNSLVVMNDEGRINEFLERPKEEDRQNITSSWVNSGILLCSPEVLELVPAATTCDLPKDIFPRLQATKRFFGFPLSGYRCAVDSPERFSEASAAIQDGRCLVSI